MALPLPPPSLPARSGSQWLVGQNVPSIGRGGAEGQRSVGVQAFEILNNNKRNLQLLPSKRIDDIAQWLQDVGVHIPEWSATGLVAGLGGLPLTTIKGVVSGKRCEPVQRVRDPPRVAAPKKDANKGLSHSGVVTTVQSKSPLSFLASVVSEPIAYSVERVHKKILPCPEIIAGLRVASLAATIISNGWSEEAFPVLLSTLDCHFPRQFGDINHSRYFLNLFRQSLVAEAQSLQTKALHAIVPALKTPSHLVRAFDTISPKSGEVLLEEVVYYTNERGRLSWMLLDMVPLASDVTHIIQSLKRASDDEDLATCLIPAVRIPSAAKMPALEHHAAEKISDLLIATERRHLLSDAEMRWRLAQNTGDGAFFGNKTGDKIAVLLAAKQGIEAEKCPGQLCEWHGVVKVLEHADHLEEHGGGGFMHTYNRLTKYVRNAFAFGTGQKVGRSVARELKLRWLRPIAKQEGGTRTAMYECKRVPPVLFNNLAIYYRATICTINMLRAPNATKTTATRKEIQKLRKIGKMLMDLPMLVFSLARYSMRQPLLHYGECAQSLSVTGFERVRIQSSTLRSLDENLSALHVCRGVVGISMRMATFIWPWARQFGLRSRYIDIASFLQVVLQASGVSRRLPYLAKHIVHVCVRHS